MSDVPSKIYSKQRLSGQTYMVNLSSFTKMRRAHFNSILIILDRRSLAYLYDSFSSSDLKHLALSERAIAKLHIDDLGISKRYIINKI